MIADKGFLKGQTSKVDEEIKGWCLWTFAEQVAIAERQVFGSIHPLDTSPDPTIGGYIAGLVDGAMQRAGLGEDREAVLATTKAVMVSIYQETGGEPLYNISSTGIVNETAEIVSGYEKALDDHSKSISLGRFPITLSTHFILRRE